MDEWYYVSQGSELGPVSWDTLKEMIAKDQLSRNALVKQGVNGRFILAKRVRGLVDLTAKPLVIPGQRPPSVVAAPTPPPAPVRTAQPTISFTPAKPIADIALPPMAMPPTLTSASLPASPAAAPAELPQTAGEAVAKKKQKKVEGQLPPPAVPTPPPLPKKVQKRKEIDDLLPPTAG